MSPSSAGETPAGARGSCPPRSPRRAAWTCSLALLAALLVAPAARAHEGPPYPVIVDETHGPWSVSVWADPDVGIGTFWVQLTRDAEHDLPDDTQVHVSVAPSDGRVEPVRYAAREEPWQAGQSHVAEVDFPTREFWTVRIELDSPSRGARAELVVNVEVTPPGYGPIDLLLYSWPFAALGLLWLRAMQRQRQARRRAADACSLS